ncbi:MAG: hypothetical protein KDH20_10555 [Rhodocyclaceae bacterium]|nr:hypothetical protein [Rhodocyclaceae bacterium]
MAQDLPTEPDRLDDPAASFDAARIAARIEAAVQDGAGLTPQAAREIAFHMTDWLDELARYAAFCRSPDAIDDAALADLLTAFLCHVPEHLAAAGRLHTGLPLQDIFGVGAVEPNER